MAAVSAFHLNSARLGTAGGALLVLGLALLDVPQSAIHLIHTACGALPPTPLPALSIFSARSARSARSSRALQRGRADVESGWALMYTNWTIGIEPSPLGYMYGAERVALGEGSGREEEAETIPVVLESNGGTETECHGALEDENHRKIRLGYERLGAIRRMPFLAEPLQDDEVELAHSSVRSAAEEAADSSSQPLHNSEIELAHSTVRTSTNEAVGSSAQPLHIGEVELAHSSVRTAVDEVAASLTQPLHNGEVELAHSSLAMVADEAEDALPQPLDDGEVELA
eukprot:scaffold292477_cov37-Tisochrysis_lutea.AAC.1